MQAYKGYFEHASEFASAKLFHIFVIHQYSDLKFSQCWAHKCITCAADEIFALITGSVS